MSTSRSNQSYDASASKQSNGKVAAILVAIKFLEQQQLNQPHSELTVLTESHLARDPMGITKFIQSSGNLVMTVVCDPQTSNPCFLVKEVAAHADKTPKALKSLCPTNWQRMYMGCIRNVISLEQLKKLVNELPNQDSVGVQFLREVAIRCTRRRIYATPGKLSNSMPVEAAPLLDQVMPAERPGARSRGRGGNRAPARGPFTCFNQTALLKADQQHRVTHTPHLKMYLLANGVCHTLKAIEEGNEESGDDAHTEAAVEEEDEYDSNSSIPTEGVVDVQSGATSLQEDMLPFPVVEVSTPTPTQAAPASHVPVPSATRGRKRTRDPKPAAHAPERATRSIRTAVSTDAPTALAAASSVAEVIAEPSVDFLMEGVPEKQDIHSFLQTSEAMPHMHSVFDQLSDCHMEVDEDDDSNSLASLLPLAESDSDDDEVRSNHDVDDEIIYYSQPSSSEGQPIYRLPSETDEILFEPTRDLTSPVPSNMECDL